MEDKEQTSEISVRKVRKKKGAVSRRQGAEVAGKPKSVKARAASTTKKRPSGNLANLSNVNVAWIAKNAAETGHSLTAVLNRAVDSVRLGKPMELEEFIPTYVKRALEQKARRIERLKKLASI